MKKILILTAALISFAFAGSAQTMVVNSETVFKSMASYNDAISTLDKMGQQYQTTIDNAYAEVEKMFNDYQEQRSYLSENSRVTRENAILAREKEIIEAQEKIFGQDGDLMKRRIELIKPIQDRVFNVINNYAAANGYTVVIDIASNPTVLYYSPAVDKTEEIVKLVK